MEEKEKYLIEESPEERADDNEQYEGENNVTEESPEEEREVEEPQEEVAEEAEAVKPKRWNKVKALKEHSRELERKNAELLFALQQKEQEFNKVNDQNLYNYGSNTLSQLKNAEDLYKQAFKQGTVDDITTASANYNLALNDYREAERTISAFQRDREYAKLQQEDSIARTTREVAKQEAEKERFANQWLRENPDLNQKSPYYDPKLTELVINEVEKINDYLASQGAEHLKGSREYFDKIDEFVEFYKNETPSNLKGYSVNTRNKVSANTGHKTITLNASEQQIANGLGMTAKEYKEYQADMPAEYRAKRR